jgi:hypothetical protein
MSCMCKRFKESVMVLFYAFAPNAIKCKKLMFRFEGLQSHAVLIIVYEVYRAPSKSMNNFVEQILPPFVVSTVVLGDFNQDLLEKHAHASPLLRLMVHYEFHKYLGSPTIDTGTMLDHICFRSHQTKKMRKRV